MVNRYDFAGNSKNDILSGLTVALALVPEAIAFAFVAHVEPLVGLYAAFIVGFVTSICGGRSGMISGATGAMAVVMVGLVVIHGVEYLFATVILTGLIQIAAGLFRLGKFIRLVPYPVMLGFVNGLAIVIFLAQLGQFKSNSVSAESTGHSALDVLFTGGWLQSTEMTIMITLTLLTMGIIFILPKIPHVGKLLPAPLASIIIVSFLVIILNLDTKSVGDLATLSGGLPTFHIPAIPISFATLLIIIPYAFTLAGIGLVESLLTLTLIDEITDTKGHPNLECFGQGLANLTCGFFKAMGGCAMIGQSMINMESGGRGRLSGLTASVALLAFILFFSGLIEMIPLAALTGIMMMVVIGTFAWPSLKLLLKVPKEDALVIVLVTVVTVIQDLAIAVLVGVIVSSLVYAWKSSRQIEVKNTEEYSSEEQTYALQGNLFFGSTTKFKEILNPNRYNTSHVLLDVSGANLLDHSALEALDSQITKFKEAGKTLDLKNVQPDSLKKIERTKKIYKINIVN
tara:strand:- start:554 stop:2095 length:1542 start_codon:yes stop_codon:yes gene_type:complete